VGTKVEAWQAEDGSLFVKEEDMHLYEYKKKTQDLQDNWNSFIDQLVNWDRECLELDNLDDFSDEEVEMAITYLQNHLTARQLEQVKILEEKSPPPVQPLPHETVACSMTKKS
jgi:hypothetical protein